MFIMVAGFVGGMQIATDSTAGERERGSLEPLLVNPAPRVRVRGGQMDSGDARGDRERVPDDAAVRAADAAVAARGHGHPPPDRSRARRRPSCWPCGPLCLFTAALQAAVATLARSFKEAQTYMGVLILAPMLPGVMSALYPLGNATWMYAIPMLGPYILLTDVLGGRLPDAMRVSSRQGERASSPVPS